MYKPFSQIKSIFNSLKKKSKFDLSKTKLHVGNLKKFPNIRDFAYTTIEKYPQIYISPKLKFESLEVIKAILMHEISHAILISKKKKHSELQTDNFAKKLFNKHIYYNKNDLQTLKKTKKVKRPKYLKNPKHINDELIHLLKRAYRHGEALFLSDAIVYMNQGNFCTDCKMGYNMCKCEYCEDCGYNRCMCNLNIPFYDHTSVADEDEKEKVRKRVLEIVNTLPEKWKNKYYYN